VKLAELSAEIASRVPVLSYRPTFTSESVAPFVSITQVTFVTISPAWRPTAVNSAVPDATALLALIAPMFVGP
jgi:hypothetical protein